MNLHTSAFWACVFFLLGILGASVFGLTAHFWIMAALVITTSAAVLLFFNKHQYAVLIFVALLGVGYYQWSEARMPEFSLPFEIEVSFTGLIERVTKTDSGQQIDIRLKSFNNLVKLLNDSQGMVRVYAPRYPEVHYGDTVGLMGKIKPLPDDRRGYYAKEGIQALLSFPKKFEIVNRDQGSRIKSVLFKIRDYIHVSFEKVLPPESATLMTGLVIGKSSGFSKEFSEKLRLTGTTHLVALSGYNIAMIIKWFLAFFGFIMSRRYAVWFCVLAVIGFVVMTGAEASVVRAAIMAGIMIVAERTERTRSTRNAIAVTAVVMVLFNPHVLVFDIGFQLSFAALLGIVYLKPIVDRWLKFDPKKPGTLEWRKNLATTIAAQIAVIPILLTNFGFVTPISIVTNLLILSFIPITMILGVCILGASLISASFAFFIALPARLLLWYELGIINLFSKIDFGLEIHNFPIIFLIVFYAFIGWIALRDRSRKGET